jgi:hypothetical protein
MLDMLVLEYGYEEVKEELDRPAKLCADLRYDWYMRLRACLGLMFKY